MVYFIHVLSSYSLPLTISASFMSGNGANPSHNQLTLSLYVENSNLSLLKDSVSIKKNLP